MGSVGPLARTPFYFLGRRLYREAELVAYLRREHHRGRPLAEILEDSGIDRWGAGVLRAVLARPDLIRALTEDVTAEIALSRPEGAR
jgi:hypothetical protein